MAEKLEDLQVWHRASEFWVAVNAILDRPGFRQDLKLREQIRSAIDSITANMSEGFAQPTNRAFANFLSHSKGSTAETRTRLDQAFKRGYITAVELKTRDDLGDEVARMLCGLIKYLRQTDRRDRGLGRGREP